MATHSFAGPGPQDKRHISGRGEGTPAFATAPASLECIVSADIVGKPANRKVARAGNEKPSRGIEGFFAG